MTDEPRPTVTDVGDRRYFHRALLVALIAPLYEWARIVFTGGILHRTAAVTFAPVLFLAAAGLWHFGFPVLMAVSSLLRLIIGRAVSREAWQQVTWDQLRRWPAACALGVATWLVYSIGSFGGWPDDVIFGAGGNLIGAWAYLPIFCGWLRLIRAQRASSDTAPGEI